MKTYELSVFLRQAMTAAMVVHVFTIEVTRPLSWVKEHADQMASTFNDGALRGYVALNVKES